VFPTPRVKRVVDELPLGEELVVLVLGQEAAFADGLEAATERVRVPILGNVGGVDDS